MASFSIIVPLYNKENFVAKTLQSVLDQSFTDFELLIVNDGSTDKSEQQILGFKDERIRYFHKENGGASTARNYGIDVSTSNYITFLDADDYWYPDFLQEMFRSIDKFPGEKIFAAAIEIEMPEKTFAAQYAVEKKSEPQLVNYFDASAKTSILWTSCATFHKSIFAEVGPFDTSLKSGQDTDLWIRMGLLHPVVFSSKILARYTYDADSLSKNTAYLNKKLHFSKFSEAEKTNASLKKFLDFNRFSFALKAKLNNDGENFRAYLNAIDARNLSLKRKILLRLPAAVLQLLLRVNFVLLRLGVSNSAFK